MSVDRLPEDKVVIFRFVGGPRDAGQARSDAPLSSEQIAGEVRTYWALTKGGTKGHRLPVISENDLTGLSAGAVGAATADTWRIHYYDVTDRKDEPTCITVTCEYRESEQKGK